MIAYSPNASFNPHPLCAMLVEDVPRQMWRDWEWPIVPGFVVLLSGFLYARGWVKARSRRAEELPPWRVCCFYAGLLSLWLAIASPLDALDDYLLAAHMIQHFVLMSVVPPLLLLGAPAVPLVRGLPAVVVRKVLRPILLRRWYHRFVKTLLHPAVLWLLMNVAYLGWHVPAAFELTFHSELVHNFEHLCFLGTSIGFWWFVIQPWPAHSRFPGWVVIPYLLTSDLLNTILSAFLAFSGRVLYVSYAQAPRISKLTALQDQVAAGSEMWILNSVVFLVPAVITTIRLLSPGNRRFGRHVAKVVAP